ncbi:hypothetical protein ACFOY2_37875 [Nonomuraea purpurea]|uniref:Uncharacterized protein n=1 Tax=Nonomuraea purpurea TaxID=1849276 RepID=A0ABV8GJT8_9ACTN
MDVEAEIIELKLRIEELEARQRSGSQAKTASNDFVRMEDAVLGARTEICQDIAAFCDELAGFWRYTDEHFRFARAEILEKLTALQCAVIELGLKMNKWPEEGWN